MNQKKIGQFLKELRKQKNLTQEELAERFGITSRSVSRWETGKNLPDLSILVELAAFYEIDIKDIINGGIEELVEEIPDDSISKVVAYAGLDKQHLMKKMIRSNLISLIMITISMALCVTNEFPFISDETRNLLLGFSLGLSLVITLRNIFVFGGKDLCFRTRH